jgi:adenylate kinase family enzyme
VQRICIIGATGSGKTTLARAVATRLELPGVELDALNWGPNWTAAPPDVLPERVVAAVAGDRWVVDGNYYNSVLELTVVRADTIVWIDLPFHETFRRLVARTFRRWGNREELWNGNRERLATQFFSRDSIFLWCISTYPRRKREYPGLLAQCAARGQQTARLRSQDQIDACLYDSFKTHPTVRNGTEPPAHSGLRNSHKQEYA